MSEIECEFCGEKLQTKSSLNLHKAKTKACIEFQIKKLGKPLSEINKEKKAIEEAKIAKKKAEKAEKDKKKAEKDKKKAEKDKKKAEKEKSRKAAEKAYREAEEEIAKKKDEKEIVTETDDDSEIDENAEIPLSSSEDESSSSESEEEEHYKVKEQSTVKEEFDNIENYQRTNPTRLNNLFKKKSTTVKTEIIREDQPPEVHKRKIEEYLQPVNPVSGACSSNGAPLERLGPVIAESSARSTSCSSSPVTPTIDIKALSEDINKNIEKKINSSIFSLETKINSLIDVMGKVTVSISSLEKRMKSIEASVDIDIERIMDDKLDDMFSITRKMLAEVESKSELLDIFRENMEDIVDKHYDLYKKFKYVKEDIEDMVYASRRR